MITEEQDKRAGEMIREIIRENEERENNVFAQNVWHSWQQVDQTVWSWYNKATTEGIMNDKIRVVKILTLSEKMGWPYKVAEIVHDKNEQNKIKYS